MLHNVLFIYMLKYGVTHEETEADDREFVISVKKQLLRSFQICWFFNLPSNKMMQFNFFKLKTPKHNFQHHFQKLKGKKKFKKGGIFGRTLLEIWVLLKLREGQVKKLPLCFEMYLSLFLLSSIILCISEIYGRY